MSSTDRPAILVTGGAGYIGSHTCKALARAGYLPVTLDNLSLGHRWAVRWGPLEIIDLLDTSGVVHAMRRHCVTSVVHFAASAYVADSVMNPAFYYRNNVLTTLSLLDAMRMAGVRDLVFSSSCAFYGNPTYVPIDEEHPARALSPYGQTKLDCEHAIRWFCRAYALRAIALRYFNAAGADPEGEIGECHDPETRVVPRALFAAMGRGPELEIFGSDYGTADGTAVRDYVHVSDLASAHVLALGALRQPDAPEAVNLGTGKGTSVLQLIRTVGRIAGAPVPHRFGPRREGDPAVVVALADRARRALQWTPRFSDIDRIVATAWAWHSNRTPTA